MIRQETLAGTRGNGRDAPIADLPALVSERGRPIQNGPSWATPSDDRVHQGADLFDDDIGSRRRSRMKSRGGDSGLFLDLDREHPANDAIRRRLTHMGPSSLCDRLVGRCLGETSGEDCARLFFRILGRRLVVFEPEAAIADAGGE